MIVTVPENSTDFYNPSGRGLALIFVGLKQTFGIAIPASIITLIQSIVIFSGIKKYENCEKNWSFLTLT